MAEINRRKCDDENGCIFTRNICMKLKRERQVLEEKVKDNQKYLSKRIGFLGIAFLAVIVLIISIPLAQSQAISAFKEKLAGRLQEHETQIKELTKNEDREQKQDEEILTLLQAINIKVSSIDTKINIYHPPVNGN